MATGQRIRRHNAVNDFIEQVEARLEETGMTMTELAERSKVAREYIYRILSRKQVPSLAIAEKIAAALGLSVQTVDAA